MAEISQIKLPSGTTYNLKDTTSRDKISNLTGGGRNLILNSKRDLITEASSSGSAYIPNDVRWTTYGTELAASNTVDQFTASYDYITQGAKYYNNNQPYIYFQVNGSWVEGSLNYLSSATANGHATCTFKLTTTQSTYSTRPFYFRFRLYNAADGATATISNLKVEYGNIPTDWTYAPEDLITVNESNSQLIIL